MKKWMFIVLLSLPGLLQAEPYLALREGLKCSSCHMNRTGGGHRTKMGAGYGTQALSWVKLDLRDKNIPHYWSLMDELISFGGDLRFQNKSTFIEDNAANTFETDKANLYLSVHLLPDTLDFYIDERVAPGGAQSREIFGMWKNLPGNSWIKAGKFVLPYGIRLEDDRAFVREVTGFTFDNPDIGAEVGLEPGRWSFITSFTNGTAGSIDDNPSKQVVGSASFVADVFRIGVSGSYNSGESGDKNSGALWGGFTIGKAVFLGEADLVQLDSGPAGTKNQIVTHAELDYLILDGMNFKAAYEFFDPDTGVDEDQRDRVLLGVEFFPVPFVHAGIYYRFNQSIPQNLTQNADELTFRLHFYF